MRFRLRIEDTETGEVREWRLAYPGVRRIFLALTKDPKAAKYLASPFDWRK
jgi:hypothetical protein